MSNKTTLQTNNTNLASYSDRVAALINIANSLPEAGSGGASIETCTVTFSRETNRNCYIIYQSDSGVSIIEQEQSSNSISYTVTCLCGSLIVLGNTGTGEGYITNKVFSNNIENLRSSAYDDVLYLKAPTTAGETGTVDVY